jgi:ABC-2 type transport system permease protein
MSRIRLIAMREWSTRLKQRSFQITTVIQILVVLIVALLPIIIARFTGDDAATGASVVVVDEANAGIAERMSPYLQGDGDSLESITISTGAGSLDAARTLVDDGDAESALIASRDENDVLRFTLITEDGDWSSTNVQRIYAAASAIAMEDRLVQSGISAQEAQQVFTPVAFDVQGVSGEGTASDPMGSNDANAAEYAIAYIATILMFIAVVMYGTWIAQGVVEEKSSRIMEIMVNAATPRDLLAGKVIGIMLAGLTQLLPMLLAGGLAFGFQPQIADMVGVDVGSVLDIDFGALSIKALGFFMLYFLVGFVLYGSLYAGIGSLVSRQEEVSQAIAPMMTFMMIGYFGAFFVLGAPDSTVAKWLMIFPLTSPFAAIPRILLGNPGMGEIVLSVVLLVLTAIAGVLLAGKLYRVGVLMYGQRPSWKSMIRMGRMQQVAR